jgi:hypothetical protein
MMVEGMGCCLVGIVLIGLTAVLVLMLGLGIYAMLRGNPTSGGGPD